MKPSRPNRQPAHLEYVGGKSPRQRIWELIRAWQGDFTLAELTGRVPARIHADTVRTYVVSLFNAGILARVTDQQGAQTGYCLANDQGVEAPRVRKDGRPVIVGRGQENMWRTLRALNRPFHARELAALASTPESPVSPVAARDYLRRLQAAGYFNFDERPAADPHYRLILNTGPRPPMVQRIHRVYDPNLGQIMWTEPGIGEDGHE